MLTASKLHLTPETFQPSLLTKLLDVVIIAPDRLMQQSNFECMQGDPLLHPFLTASVLLARHVVSARSGQAYLEEQV